MTMSFFVKYAKWVIFSVGILLFVGLIWMGNFDLDSGSQDTNVGFIDGTPVPLDGFREDLTRLQEQERERTGKTPEGIAFVKLRDDLFESKVKEVLLGKVTRQYQLAASAEEMWAFLENNPDPAIQSDTFFQTSGQFDINKYKSFLHQDGPSTSGFLQYMEERLKSTVMPALQLRQLLRSQFHQTDLEAAWDEFRQRNKAQARFYYAALGAYPLQAAPSEEELKAHFSSLPDSFYTSEDRADLGYVQIPIQPSRGDTAVAMSLVADLQQRLKSDTAFGEIAISYSDDENSAEAGGELGWQSGAGWEPEFAAVASALTPGQMSQPVLTRLGYHIIRCNGVKTDSGIRKMDVSQILVKIETTPETVDSLTEVLDQLRKAALDSGSLEKAGQAALLPWRTTGLFGKGNFFPLGEGNYVPGLHSFAFGELKKGEAYSEVLQNDAAVFLFQSLRHFPAGREFEAVRERVTASLNLTRQRELARQDLEGAVATLPSPLTSPPPASLGRALLDSTSFTSAQAWVPVFQYDHPSLTRLFRQPMGIWGKALPVPAGLVAGAVVQKEEISFDQVLAGRQVPVGAEPDFLIGQIESAWFTTVEKEAKIENNLDVIYRN